MPTPTSTIAALQKQLWAGSIPLEITIAPENARAYDQTDPYFINVPRLSYLPFIIPRLHDFFASSRIDPDTSVSEAWLSFQGLPLKWHYPIGLLYDLFSGAQPIRARSVSSNLPQDVLPWSLTLHYSDYPYDQLFPLDVDGKVLLDAFINNVKEADYIRNGTAKTVMSLSKSDSDSMWRAVQTHDLDLFESVNAKIMSPPGQVLRHIPLKIYIPTQPGDATPTNTSPDPASTTSRPSAETARKRPDVKPASVRVVQGLVAPYTTSTSDKLPTTLGKALQDLLPSLFLDVAASSLVSIVLHGAVVPMTARLEELGRAASHADGFLHLVIAVKT